MTKRALVLCTGNSCRSQMAEGYFRALSSGAWDSDSAGSNPSGYVHPLAIQVMKEEGVDLSENKSEHMDQFADNPYDLVVTVCGGAKESCPVFPNAENVVHWPFEDPAKFEGDDESTLAFFREIRDQIKQRITEYLETGN